MKIYYSSAAKPSAMSVSQLNTYVKDLLDDDLLLSNAEVTGEISNFKHYLSGGHMYFSLKDDSSSVAAVMYRNANQYLNFLPQDGMKVTVKGSVSIYPQNGKYQIYVREMSACGEGELYRQYELLKNKLFAEGLFDKARKQPLPLIPKNVGIITSKYGAALQDIINISTRRFPVANLLVYPSAVQGITAHKELIAGIKYFSDAKNVDVIIIGRGGGSIEDLWTFNNEELAREIYNCKIPVVSAVGHETDYTICDFVSDLRAPTPSAAAELVFPDINDIYMSLNAVKVNMKSALNTKIETAEKTLNLLSAEKVKSQLQKKYDRFSDEVLKADITLKKELSRKISDRESQMLYASSMLEALSPLSILQKGYSLISDNNSVTIKSVSSLSCDMPINIRLSDGHAKATVTDITQSKPTTEGNKHA